MEIHRVHYNYLFNPCVVEEKTPREKKPLVEFVDGTLAEIVVVFIWRRMENIINRMKQTHTHIHACSKGGDREWRKWRSNWCTSNNNSIQVLLFCHHHSIWLQLCIGLSHACMPPRIQSTTQSKQKCDRPERGHNTTTTSTTVTKANQFTIHFINEVYYHRLDS